MIKAADAYHHAGLSDRSKTEALWDGFRGLMHTSFGSAALGAAVPHVMILADQGSRLIESIKHIFANVAQGLLTVIYFLSLRRRLKAYFAQKEFYRSITTIDALKDRYFKIDEETVRAEASKKHVNINEYFYEQGLRFAIETLQKETGKSTADCRIIINRLFDKGRITQEGLAIKVELLKKEKMAYLTAMTSKSIAERIKTGEIQVEEIKASALKNYRINLAVAGVALFAATIVILSIIGLDPTIILALGMTASTLWWIADTYSLNQAIKNEQVTSADKGILWLNVAIGILSIALVAALIAFDPTGLVLIPLVLGGIYSVGQIGTNAGALIHLRMLNKHSEKIIDDSENRKIIQQLLNKFYDSIRYHNEYLRLRSLK